MPVCANLEIGSAGEFTELRKTKQFLWHFGV